MLYMTEVHAPRLFFLEVDLVVLVIDPRVYGDLKQWVGPGSRLCDLPICVRKIVPAAHRSRGPARYAKPTTHT